MYRKYFKCISPFLALSSIKQIYNNNVFCSSMSTLKTYVIDLKT